MRLPDPAATAAILALLRRRCPHALASTPVVVAPAQLARMAEFVDALEHVVMTPAYREQVLARAPPIARHDPHGARGVLYADKRNLALLSDAAQLEAMGLPEATRQLVCAAIQATEIVTAVRAGALWRDRRRLFFKPACGYGSRAVYRGEKLIRRVWQQILAGDYVAQDLAPAGELTPASGVARGAMKFDLRNYVHAGRRLCARPSAGLAGLNDRGSLRGVGLLALIRCCLLRGGDFLLYAILGRLRVARLLGGRGSGGCPGRGSLHETACRDTQAAGNWQQQVPHRRSPSTRASFSGRSFCHGLWQTAIRGSAAHSTLSGRPDSRSVRGIGAAAASCSAAAARPTPPGPRGRAAGVSTT